ncbi:MAG: ImmA/IrrE family metallo-endopeptidase [Chloroflexi bacterium]|nr:ImmA/IrrE family metallo-endopeptidase [Chloroflexota bacterium]
MASAYFLPLSANARAIEERAIQIKHAYGFSPYDLIDPVALADRMSVPLVDPAWLDQLPASVTDALLGPLAGTWSAGSLPVGGRLYVLLNPRHGVARQNITLMEELVHEALGHPPSTLTREGSIAIRTCRRAVEEEAYAVAAALLMPYRSTFNHLNAGLSIDSLPAGAEVSADCRHSGSRLPGCGGWPRRGAVKRASRG